MLHIVSDIASYLLCIGQNGMHWRQILLTFSKCCNNSRDCIHIVQKTYTYYYLEDKWLSQCMFGQKKIQTNFVVPCTLPTSTSLAKRILLRLFIGYSLVFQNFFFLLLNFSAKTWFSVVILFVVQASARDSSQLSNASNSTTFKWSWSWVKFTYANILNVFICFRNEGSTFNVPQNIEYYFFPHNPFIWAKGF